ncbi:DUF2301 domain-containing membrane protein [Phormidium sp. CCY1219]|uniref:DUF2301 domain-containing membrane protein n=1 Tax=Phormidium sp. CCY1219 TaxID=2886104 RepID=UPI002D1F90CE|nr:DUF2301 domain-containing membrane protein [Phormidium sp. CCY1219]MEB3829721.1 DUF2301 domain-containing membrane protein [Phormidium sp. CCY1219]
MTQANSVETPVYQGQFGEFTITDRDRREVIIYRSGLMVAALSFAIGTTLVLWQGTSPMVLNASSALYACFCIALGVSLLTIHIYLGALHRLLQLFWLVGSAAALWFALNYSTPLAVTLYDRPAALFGIGFTFAALTGIYFKEAFCFNRLETKLLTPVVPLLILGHLFGFLSPYGEKILLAIWAVLFLVFGLRKAFQAIPDDIGDKSVFEYLKKQKKAQA